MGSDLAPTRARKEGLPVARSSDCRSPMDGLHEMARLLVLPLGILGDDKLSVGVSLAPKEVLA